MTAILTPALALRHLRELSTDVRAAVALSPDGALLGGDAWIEAPARVLLDVLEEDTAALAGPRGTVVLARGPAVTLVVVAGPHALGALLQHDVRTLLSDVHDGAAAGVTLPQVVTEDASRLPAGPGTEDGRVLPAGAAAAVEALIHATQRDLAR